MKHPLWLILCLLLNACFSNEPDVAASNAPQSAMAVKDQTQTLALKPLSQAIEYDVGQDNLNRSIVDAFERRQSDVWVEGAGVVTKLLPDDNKGSRHQKFLVRINEKQTLLFAHNIDLSNRIDGLKVGDSIEFKGEYVFNPKGGVIHWTHHDPKGQHQGGWIKHQGNTFE